MQRTDERAYFADAKIQNEERELLAHKERMTKAAQFAARARPPKRR
jgi:hypothetical protein